MKLRLIPILMTLLTSALYNCCHATDITLVDAGGVVANSVAVPTADTGISNEYTFSSFNIPAGAPQKVTLELKCRYDATAQLGSLYFLKMSMNGTNIGDLVKRGIGRLENRPLTWKVGPTVYSSWYTAAYGWRALMAHNFTSTPAFYGGVDPYTLVLDISDLVSTSSGNVLKLTNTATLANKTSTGASGNIYVDKAIIHYNSGQSPTALVTQTPKDIVNTGSPGEGPAAYIGTVLNGGGFTVAVGSRTWKFNSAYSYPNAGFNFLSPTATQNTSGQSAWTVTRSGNSVTANGPTYKVERTVTFTSRRVEVSDKITNNTAASIGLIVRNEMGLDGIENAAVRMAGSPDTSYNNYASAGNPTIFVEGPGHGMGLLAEDSVYRNQVKMYVLPSETNVPHAGIKTEMLRIPASGNYTLKWAVYPVQAATGALGVDYYDFINLVRQDWNANFTAEGAWMWGFYPKAIATTNQTTLNQQVKDLGIKYIVMGGGWVDLDQPPLDASGKRQIGFGAGIQDAYWSSFRSYIQQAVTKIHNAGAKAIIYYNSQRDTSSNGLTLYAPDSKRTKSDGTHDYTDWAGQYSRTYSYVPRNGTPYGDNAFGTKMKQVANYYMTEFGADGLYVDEMENVSFGGPLLTYGTSDGYSCLLAPGTYTISNENIGLAPLLSEQHQLQMISDIQGQSGTILGNGPAHLSSTLGTGIQRMIECHHNNNIPMEGHLGVPLGYQSRGYGYVDASNPGLGATFADVNRLFTLGLLPVGIRFDYSYRVTPYLFPFTPVELHMGYLLGQERIVANHSGSYGWTGQACLIQIRKFDTTGQLASSTYGTTVAQSSSVWQAKTSVTLGTSVTPGSYTGEAVVLEKLPILVTPNSGTSTATSMDYLPEQISFNFVTAGGSTINVKPNPYPIASGKFPIVSGADYEVTVGTTTTIIAALGSGLTFSVGATETAIPIVIKPAPVSGLRMKKSGVLQ